MGGKLKPTEKYSQETEKYQLDGDIHGHDPNTRDRNDLARHEGQSTSQVHPYFVKDWDIDEPKWQFYVYNMVKNLLNRCTFDLQKDASTDPLSLIRLETHDQLVANLMTLKSSSDPVSVEMRVRLCYSSMGLHREKMHNNEIKNREIPDIDPISPFADTNETYFYRPKVDTNGINVD